MYKPISKEEAIAAAKALTHPLCTGIASYIINEHWQAIVNVKKPLMYELVMYECMDEQTGYLEGKHFSFPPEVFTEGNVADTLYTHIAKATCEWNDLLD